MWWPTLSEKIEAISLPSTNEQIGLSAEPPAPKVDNNEMIMEILDRVRSLDAGMTRSERRINEIPPELVMDIAGVASMLSIIADESDDPRLTDTLQALDRPLSYLRKRTGGRLVGGGASGSGGGASGSGGGAGEGGIRIGNRAVHVGRKVKPESDEISSD